MTNVAAPLSAILAKAEWEHSVTEAAQLSDIGWLHDEVANIAMPVEARALWRGRVEFIDLKVRAGLAELAKTFNRPRIIRALTCAFLGRDRVAAQIEARIARQLALWPEIEALELRLALEFPEVLSGEYEPHPPHLRELARVADEARVLYGQLGNLPAPQPLLDLGQALVALARELVNAGEPEDAARAAAKATELLRRIAEAEPARLHRALGGVLAVLAQSLLYCGRVEEATQAAKEACELGEIGDVPEEVRGLVGV